MRVCNNFFVVLAQKSCYNTVDMGKKVVTIARQGRSEEMTSIVKETIK